MLYSPTEPTTGTERWAWIKWNRHAITGWIWLFMLIPVLLWWRESILLVLINALYTTFKTDMGAHHALHAEKEAADG